MTDVEPPAYVLDIIEAWTTGRPLDFHGHDVPDTVRQRIEADTPRYVIHQESDGSARVNWRIVLTMAIPSFVGGLLLGSATFPALTGDLHTAAIRAGIGVALWIAVAAYATYQWHWGWYHAHCRRTTRRLRREQRARKRVHDEEGTT